ncbi:MAG TPA: hypothetical protein VGR62_24725 [Candidatus Binatia bacterium]|jgi:hypothetical protein|nr:hypothetical protein [Candidatus Binatia bacterium]
MSNPTIRTRHRWLVAVTLLLAAAGGTVATRAVADQPKMEQALTSLREARGLLKEANANKGGHRAKAVDLVEAAIKEVEAGIQYDRER